MLQAFKMHFLSMFIHLNIICNKNPKRPRFTSGADFTIGALVRVSDLTKYSSPLLSTVSLSVVSVTHGQPQSKYSQWKIPEINTSYILSHMAFRAA